MWDVPWEELLAVELAKAGCQQPSHLILHLKTFRRSENFVRVIKCNTEELREREPQAVQICSVVHKMWKVYQSKMKSLILKVVAAHNLYSLLDVNHKILIRFLNSQVPSSQRHVYFAWSEADGRESRTSNKSIIKSSEFSSSRSASDERRFVRHAINFQKIWTSERELKGRCTLCRKQVHHCLHCITFFFSS